MINSFGTGKPTEAAESGSGRGKRRQLFGLFGCSGCSAVRLFGLFGLFGCSGGGGSPPPGTMINSFGTGKPTDFFLFLFSSLLPITQNSTRSFLAIKVNRFSLIFAPLGGSNSLKAINYNIMVYYI